jgi:hypothetical protein
VHTYILFKIHPQSIRRIILVETSSKTFFFTIFFHRLYPIVDALFVEKSPIMLMVSLIHFGVDTNIPSQ